MGTPGLGPGIICDRSHDLPEVAANDIIRQERLEEYGLHFLRFADIDVKRNIDAVVAEIAEWIERNGKVVV